MISERDLQYLSVDDLNMYNFIMSKREMSEDDYCVIMGIIERLDYIIADMVDDLK